MPESRPPAPKTPPTTPSEKSPRSYSDRAERSLKDVERLLKRNDSSPQQRAMLQLQHANVLAMLDLAESIRGHSQS